MTDVNLASRTSPLNPSNRAVRPVRASRRLPPGPVLRYLYDQFSRPRGPVGYLAGRLMSHRGSNVDRNLWLVDLLALEPDHQVLEIGPGPGIALEAAAWEVTKGTLVGLDHSTTMLAQARRRNEGVVAEGRLHLLEGRAEQAAEVLPGRLGPFDRIYCMNVWHFWADQEAVVAQLAGLLDEDGKLAVGYQPRMPGATAADTDAGSRCIADQFTGTGLTGITHHQLDLTPVPVTCVMGTRSSGPRR